jgi:dihydrofolate synthase/folylpolyglutamate synthase
MKAQGFRPRGVAVLIGMLANKDAAGFLKPLWPWIGSLHSVTVEGHASHDAALFEKHAVDHAVPVAHHAGIGEAVAAIAAAGAPQAVLITGSLYLAGEVLAANGQQPD